MFYHGVTITIRWPIVAIYKRCCRYGSSGETMIILKNRSFANKNYAQVPAFDFSQT